MKYRSERLTLLPSLSSSINDSFLSIQYQEIAPSTAPNGIIYIVTTSIQGPTLFSGSMNIPITRDTIASKKITAFLDILNLVIIDSPTTSNMFCNELTAANTTDIKNSIASTCPNGICLNTAGIVINIRDGPAPAGYPNAYDAGITTKAAIIAANVSKIPVCKAPFTISSFLSRYAPQTIIPLPVIESEKKACPMALTQVSTLNR